MTSTLCNVCGSADWKVHSTPTDYISGEKFQVVQCSHCHLIFVHPQPDRAVISKYYPSGHQRAEPAAYEKMDANSRLKFIDELVVEHSGSALDVGCGKGLFLAGLRERGWQVAGTELSEVSSAYARSQGLPVLTTDVETAPYEPGSFDLITLFHVLEHLPSPASTLTVLHKLLRPGGLLLIEVPNIGSWYARTFGDDWFHYDVPRHLYHFDKQTLHRLMTDHQFVVTRTSTHNTQYDAFGAVQSFLNKIISAPNVLNNFNTKQVTISEILGSRHGSLGKLRNILGLLFSEMALVVGFPLMSLFALLTAPWLEGGTLRFFARKEAARQQLD